VYCNGKQCSYDIIAPLIGLHGLFFVTAAGALCGIAIVHFLNQKERD
jgi:hypothetical protein